MPRNPDKIDYTGNFPKGFEIFSELSDPRGQGHTRHHFGEVIFMAFTAIVCGVKSYELMEEFCELREKWLRKWLKLPNGLPCWHLLSGNKIEMLEPSKSRQTKLHKLSVLLGKQLRAELKLPGTLQECVTYFDNLIKPPKLSPEK